MQIESQVQSMQLENPGESEDRANELGPSRLVIILHQKLSVITYLLMFARAAFELDHHEAMDWSVRCFRQFFPKSAEKLTQDERGMYIPRPDSE